MKVKLKKSQIEKIQQVLKETERRKFKTEEVSEVFRMLQYWAKSIGAGEAKIKSLAELPDGYICRVNPKFRESMRAFLKRVRARKLEEEQQRRRGKEMQANADKYDELMKKSDGSKKPPDDED
jgi:hypothetical protein